MPTIDEVMSWLERNKPKAGGSALIHNDFNPRNLALRREVGGWRLCAYDWELATIGVPQHDCAEFLCFVLPPGSYATVLLREVCG